jgi:NAD(P)-dependent dehydrogenase (short-subunit alcohol dehydrogenase family)
MASLESGERTDTHERKGSFHHRGKGRSRVLYHQAVPGGRHTLVGAPRSSSQQDFPGPNFTAMDVDFTKAAVVDDAVQSVITRFGRLDVLVHLLGGFAGGQTVAETDDATWERMRDLNLTSAFHVLRAAVPHLRKSGRGRIVAIGSLTAVEPHPRLGAYITFKAALAMLVRTVALENKDAGLTANVVLPGTIDTPANRKATPNADFSNGFSLATL